MSRFSALQAIHGKLVKPRPPVTRCYVPHFHHYGDISIEFSRLKSDENNESCSIVSEKVRLN